MSPSKIRRNKARAEAHAAAKNNPDKDLISASSHESDNTNQISESGNPVQNAQSQNDSFNKENGGPSLGINFLGDSLLAKKQCKDCNIDHKEVEDRIVALAEQNSELFDPKCGFNSELYYEALAETLYSHYGEHVRDIAPISEQYVDTRDKMLIPSKSNPVTPEKNCKECKEVRELKHRSHYFKEMFLRYPLKSCKTEWISSELIMRHI